jgi:L-fuculose-phosphate aldolase
MAERLNIMTEQELREQICLIGRLMYQNGFIDGASGNISARLDDGRILSTASGLAKGFMKPDQLIIVNMDGERVDDPTPANAELRPTSEVLMHLECYQQREDVNGVVHAHPPVAVALTIAGYNFEQCIIPEVIVSLGLIPTAPYAQPASAENRDSIRELVRVNDAMMLAHHGSLTVAKTVWEAYLKLENLEHNAHVLYMVETLGGPKQTLPYAEVEKLLAVRRRLGKEHVGDAERFQKAAGISP